MGLFFEMLSQMEKLAENENEVDSEGKIPAIEKALSDSVARKVATMLATSHEYKKPNVDGALALVKNYAWEETTMRVADLQGIDKPVKQEKVDAIAEKLDPKKLPPLIVVDKIHGIRPQSRGKRILLDGHHRKFAMMKREIENTPVYLGKYTGDAELSTEELRQKD